MANRRRFLLVDKDFQFSFALVAVLVVIIFVNLLMLLGFFLFEPLQNVSLTFVHVTSIAALELGIISVVMFYSLKTSRAMAGPVQGMIRGMTEIAGGNLTVRLAIREGEFFDEMLESFNDNLAELADRVNEAKRLIDELAELEADDERATGRFEELRRIMASIRTR